MILTRTLGAGAFAAALTLWSMWVYLHSAWPIMVSGSYSGVNGASAPGQESADASASPSEPEPAAAALHAVENNVVADDEAESESKAAS